MAQRTRKPQATALADLPPQHHTDTSGAVPLVPGPPISRRALLAAGSWAGAGAAGVLCVGTLSTGTAWAQATSDWPTKPLRIIVPAPAGGPFDRLIRPIAQDMATTLGQPIVIDNRPSAGNIVGTQAGAQAAPDGYTLTMTGMINTITAGLHDKLPYDIVQDFAHIAAIGEGAQWLVTRADSGINTLPELLARARKEPGKLAYASSGAGSSGHLLMELLQRATGTEFLHVPYKGGAPALNDTLGGVVPLLAIPQNAVQAHVQAGRLKGLAVSGHARSPAAPQIPTFAEQGFPQMTVTTWVGLSAPKGTPAAVVRKVHAALQATLAKPAITDPHVAEGLAIMKTSPEQYAALVRSDTERWGQLVRALNLKAQ
jgi:tripartite-type tricarboxylate transporter receptor subunit TctC